MMRTRTANDGAPSVEVVDHPGVLVPRAVLRPLDRGETAPLERVFAGMSARSRRARYLSGTPALTPGVLAGLADVDHDRHGSWLASVGSDPVGVGRYIRTANDPAVAEIALEVADRYQSHGLGRLLRDVVGTAAADVGVTSLFWLMDETNLRIRHLAVPLRGRFRLEYGVIEGTTGLPSLPDLEAAAVIRAARAARSRPAVRRAA
jgi:GNAT superfamily N-acetyltransferase